MDLKPEIRRPLFQRTACLTTRKTSLAIITLAALWVLGWHVYEAEFYFSLAMQSPQAISAKLGCPFPLPNHLLKERPLCPSEGPLRKSSKKLDAFLSERASHPDIDSLSIAVVTPYGTIFERGYGVLKANETVSQKPVSRHSIYRIASITKMFTVLETLILRERGVLNFDDPVEMFLPELEIPVYGWSEYLNGGKNSSLGTRPRITLRQLASHMSGIGRDYPPFDIGEWPQIPSTSTLRRMQSQGSLPLPERGQRTFAELVKFINKYPLINLPYDYPIYSNSGMDLLGLSNVAANKLRAGSNSGNEPQSHEELVKRDIFDPLGLNGSFYRVPYGTSLVDNLAVPNQSHEWADITFDDAEAPAGGQYSSLADLETVMQTILDPVTNNGVISEHVVREWLHPLFTWKNNLQEVGAPWEIMTIENNVRLYMKGGNLPGYHSEFVLVPEFQYGIIVLVTGTYQNTAAIVQEAASLYQPAIRSLLENRVNNAYVGRWVVSSSSIEKGETTTAQVKLINGALYLTELIVRGHDVLKIIEDSDFDFHKPYPIALWNTGRPNEFRLAFGRKSLNNDPSAGCMPYWVSIDNGSVAVHPLTLFIGKEMSSCIHPVVFGWRVPK
ncbi:hypothetical protein Agabi119p4_237 [Agaricus bisporus var. burnettii]|uniref:Beta-lactamase-related domain-containing protein n=1 Tax=Agaricus bisporus var. burnettii TaxID=192524 RepID=A0A8H7FA78_AGABI|nr:hypothetical protein Agabi119p4_237 [Agaricus bisporus var. burnettii]